MDTPRSSTDTTGEDVSPVLRVCPSWVGWGSIEFCCSRARGHRGEHAFYERDFTVSWSDFDGKAKQ